MPTTNTLRHQYPELVTNWTKPTCDYSNTVGVAFMASSAFEGGRVKLKFHPAVADAFQALAMVLNRWDYRFMERSGGSLNCRLITGGTLPSLHAHGIALDINPSKNGYKRVVGGIDDPETLHQEGILQWGKYTDLSPSMIRAIEAIKTKNGKRVFQWGGRWWNIKDPMHFEINVLKADLATGIDWTTVQGDPVLVGSPTEEEMVLKLTTPHTKGPAVTRAQKLIVAFFAKRNQTALGNFGSDGDYGGETVFWVNNTQQELGYEPTGVWDGLLASDVRADLGGAQVDLSGLLPKTTFAAHKHSEGVTGTPI